MEQFAYECPKCSDKNTVQRLIEKIVGRKLNFIYMLLIIDTESSYARSFVLLYYFSFILHATIVLHLSPWNHQYCSVILMNHHSLTMSSVFAPEFLIGLIQDNITTRRSTSNHKSKMEPS